MLSRLSILCFSASISIHAPLSGVRRRHLRVGQGADNFNPRTPERGATQQHRVAAHKCTAISIHAPLSGVRPGFFSGTGGSQAISIHAPLSGVRLDPGSRCYSRMDFNPRTPERGATANMHNSVRCFSGNFTKNMHICSHGHFSATGIAAENTAITCFRRCEAPGKTMFIPGSHRIKASAAPPAHRSAWRRHARRDSDNCCRGCRSADYPSPGQSAPQGDA